MAEDNLRRALVLTAGDATPFFTRPISIILVVLLLMSVLGPTQLGRAVQRRLTRRRSPA